MGKKYNVEERDEIKRNVFSNIRNNLTRLYDFYIVSKTRNLSSAAKINKTSQSTLSRSITNLELIIGEKLIIRGNKGVQLTRKGVLLSEYLSELFSNF